MIKIIYKITVLVIIIICSCSDKNKNMLVFEKEQNTDIECISISLPTSDILGVSMQLLQIDSILLINDFFGDSLIHVLDVKNKIEHGKMVAKGVGPNEFISPLGIFKTDSNLYIYERQTSRLFSLPIEMVLSQHKNIKLNFTANTQDEHSIINNLFPLSDSMFIASKIDDGIKRFAVYNSKGEKVNEFGEFKAYWDREKDFSNRVRNFFHQTFSKNILRRKCLLLIPVIF